MSINVRPNSPSLPAPRPAAAPPGKQAPASNQVAQAAPKGNAAPVDLNARINTVNAKVAEIAAWATVGHTVIDQSVKQLLKPSQRGVETALKVLPRLVAQRQNFARAMDVTINQSKWLMQQPSVRNNATLLNKVKTQLQTAQNIKARELAGFNSRIGSVQRFLGNNASLVNGPLATGLARLGTAINIVGAGATGVSAYQSSPATTDVGRAVDGLLSGAGNYGLATLMGSTPPGAVLVALDGVTGGNMSGSVTSATNSAAALLDVAMTGRLDAAGGLNDKNRTGGNGALIQAAAHVSEALSTLGDPAKMADFSERAMNGDMGVVAQFASHLGNSLGMPVRWGLELMQGIRSRMGF
ncbi:hypothetical protein HMI49_20015 [Corallococcus exercitus]|uniref:Uncharacterized protein n=1 Tax=Corallococcus exercitus TaxID=2316736 RepID=A0A7Y4KKH8_9BACT|nr:hypothetical protein [Corallococcus exercitus]NOK35493.1 hypothetical protein [Corallococcus exercitus]